MHRNPETMLFVVGARGRQYCQNKKIPIVEEFHYSAAFATVWEARKICTGSSGILRRGPAGRDRHHLHRISERQARSVPAKLPSAPGTQPALSHPGRAAQTGKEFVPDPDTVLEGIIPSYLTGFIYSCPGGQLLQRAGSPHDRHELRREKCRGDIKKASDAVQQPASGGHYPGNGGNHPPAPRP